MHHRLLPANVLTERGIRRQFQHPTFSRNSKYVAFAEIHFKEGAGCVRADAVVYEVPKDPKTYGTFDSLPLFDSGELQEAPFYLTFSPDTESLYMLCAARGPNPNPGTNGTDYCTTLVSMDWGKFHRKDSWAGQAAVARFAPRKVRLHTYIYIISCQYYQHIPYHYLLDSVLKSCTLSFLWIICNSFANYSFTPSVSSI